jgi:hypothetical protein
MEFLGVAEIVPRLVVLDEKPCPPIQEGFEGLDGEEKESKARPALN